MDCCCYSLSSLQDPLSRNKCGISWKKAAKSLNIRGFNNLPGYELLFVDENRRQMLCFHSHFLHLLRRDESKQKVRSKYIHYCYYKKWNSNQAQSLRWPSETGWDTPAEGSLHHSLTTSYFALVPKCFPFLIKKPYAISIKYITVV